MMKTTTLVVLLAVFTFPLAGYSLEFHDPVACNTATTILCGTELNNQTNSGYPNKLDNYNCAGADFASGYNGSERIYRLNVSTRQNYIIRLDDVADPAVNFDLFLMRGSCEARNCVASSNNLRNNPDQISQVLDPGTYYLIVDTWKDEYDTFDLSVTCAPENPPVYCTSAIGIECGELISGSTLGSDNDFDATIYNCYSGPANYRGADNIYSFYKESSSDRIQINLLTSNKNLDIILVSGCGQYGFSCNLTGTRFSEGVFIDEQDFGFPRGTYYVIVDGETSTDAGNYQLIVTCGVNDENAELIDCDSPKLDEDLADGINFNSNYTCGEQSSSGRQGLISPEKKYYFDVNRSGNYTVQVKDLGAFDGLEVFLYKEYQLARNCRGIGKLENGYLRISGQLEPGRYIVVVDGVKAGRYSIELFGCECTVNGTLSCDEPIADNNTGGGNNIGQISGPCTSQTLWTKAQDKVYDFTAPESQYYIFRLSEMSKDLDLFLLRECANPLSCLGASTKAGADEYIRVYLEKDQTVYALVDGWASLVKSDYIISVSCEDDTDGDGINDEDDNCPTIENPNQVDTDNDGEGDICDTDDDGDGVLDDVDCDPLDDTITTQAGDSCNDGNALTINDRINDDCNCVGQLDSDGDGVLDTEDLCPNTPEGATVNSGGCADVDQDGFFPGAVGSSMDPDDNDPCVPDNSSPDCAAKPIQLTVENGTGAVGDTICVDILATDFTNVSSGSFSITLDNDLARILSINNIGLAGGSFTGSISSLASTGSGNQVTGSGAGGGGFVVWSATPGQSLSLGTITPIVEVCLEIVTDTLDKATLTIDNSIKDVEFFDLQANELETQVGSGTICRDTTATEMLRIEGNVVNIAAEAVGGVQMALSGSRTAEMTTATDGLYAFAAPARGQYEITPKMLEETMQNVSLMDVVVFRKHFIYKESFSHPYQYIAADIDGNDKLSIRDELLMKNMLLGIDGGAYPYWTFVKSDHVFGSITDFTMDGEVFDYPSKASVNRLEANMQQDFVAVRMGDLDADLTEASIRSLDKKDLQVDDQFLRAGSKTQMVLRSPENIDMAGLMIALDIDENKIDYSNIKSELSGVSFDFNKAPNGNLIITMISDDLSTTVVKGQALITLDIESKQTLLLSEAISLATDRIPSEVINRKLESSQLELEFESANLENAEVSIYPNPTARVATLEFVSPVAYSNGLLHVYDVSGRQINKREVTIKKGRNTITVDKQLLNINKGIIYYDLTFGGQSHQGKLIIVD